MSTYPVWALTLPFPPSNNRYYRHARGRHYIDQPGRDYRKAVAGIVKGIGMPKLTGRLHVTIHAAPPDRRRRDLDNMLKALLDALTVAEAYEDDSQIDSIGIKRVFPVKGGKIHIAIEAAA